MRSRQILLYWRFILFRGFGLHKLLERRDQSYGRFCLLSSSCRINFSAERGYSVYARKRHAHKVMPDALVNLNYSCLLLDRRSCLTHTVAFLHHSKGGFTLFASNPPMIFCSSSSEATFPTSRNRLSLT